MAESQIIERTPDRHGHPHRRQRAAADDPERAADPADPQHRRLPRHGDAAERRAAEEQEPARRSDARRKARSASSRRKIRTSKIRRWTICTPSASPATILKLFKLPDGNQSIIVHGLTRFRLLELEQTDPFAIGQIEMLEDMLDAGAGAGRAGRVGAPAGEPRDRAVAQHARRSGAGAQQHHQSIGAGGFPRGEPAGGRGRKAADARRAGRRKAPAHDRRATGDAARCAGAAEQDPVAGQGEHRQEPAALLPAGADEGDPQGAGRRRRRRRRQRGRAAPREARRRQASRERDEGSRPRADAAGIDPQRLARSTA